MAKDLAEFDSQYRDPRGVARGTDRHLLLPASTGEAAQAVRPCTAGFPDLHAALAWLVGDGAAFRGQCPDLYECADERLQLGLFPAVPTGLHFMVRGRCGDAVLGARRVLRLALPVRRVAGAYQPHRAHFLQDTADPIAVGPARAFVADQVRHFPGAVRPVALLAHTRRAGVGSGA